MSGEKIYDFIIIGGGGAGYSAAIYAGRARMSALVLVGSLPGGQTTTTNDIENYPGFPDGITGPELMELFRKQAEKFAPEFDDSGREVTKIELNGDVKILHLNDGSILKAYAVLIATGASHKKLNVKGEKEFSGRGVSYCATCDGAFYRNMPIAVAGGGDSAIDEGLFLTRFGSKIYIIHRRDQLRATKILQERARSNPKIEFVLDTVIEEISGDKFVKNLKLKNVKTGVQSELKVDGIFIFVGLEPNTAFVKGLIEMNEQGYIKTNEVMETNIKGIYSAGDCRMNSYRQLATAVGDGVTASIAAEKYIEELSHKKT